MIKNLLLILFVSITFSCANNADQEATSEIPVDTVKQKETSEVAAAINSHFQKIDAPLKENNFHKSGERQIDNFSEYPIEQDVLKPFLPHLIYNSDSSKAIDPYSYNYIITNRNGSRKIDEAGPDTEIAVIDVKKQTRKRIWFSGPATTIIDIEWLNPNQIVLSGIEEVSSNEARPFVHLIDLSSQSLETFQSDVNVNVKQKGFLKNKLQSNISSN